MIQSKIKGMGKFLPEKILTNFDLEKMVDTTDEWITERSGIKERRISNENETASFMGTEALKKACENSNISEKDIDFIICATNSPDTLFPSTSMKILEQLNIKDKPCVDLQAGCTSFCYGLEIADSLIKSGSKYNNIAIVGAEKLTSLIDWTDRSICVLFGDGAGAAIISKNTEDDSGIINSILGGDSTKTQAITLQAGLSLNPTTEETIKNKLHYIKMDGQDVFKFAVKIIPYSIKKLLKKENLTIDDIKVIIPHQANIRIVEAAAKFLKAPIDKFYLNINKYGNTSSASIPIAITEAFEEKKINKGDLIITVGFGAGLTYAANLIKI